MFSDNTVFVIGAGASAEFNLPVGWQLMDAIKKNSKYRFDAGRLKNGNPEILDELTDFYAHDRGQIQLRLDAMNEIHRSIDLAGSIDEFINRHYDDPVIAETGKLQIAYAIARAEMSSLMARPKNGDEPFQWDALSETWIHTFT